MLEYYISSLQNERLFIVKIRQLRDPLGFTAYLQFVFTASRMVVETTLPVAAFGLRPITVARMVYTARLLKDGTLAPQAVADFSVSYGTPYSARHQALDQLPLVAPASY